MARLLVVEDDERIGRVLQSSLQATGHDVTWQRTGRSALAAAAGIAYDLTLLDLGLPDMDGIEVCRRVRGLSLDSQPRMVALTGWGREDDRRRTREAGFDRHLVKPPELAAIHAICREIEQRRGTVDA